MTYEKPELTALTTAVSAIQSTSATKIGSSGEDADFVHNLVSPAYGDWE